MRNFFERQESARRKTSLLLFLFSIAVVSMVIGVYAILTSCYFLFSGRVFIGAAFPFWDPLRFILIGGSTFFFIISGSLYKIHGLKSGGLAIAKMMGGRLVPRNTAEMEERRLLNVVEEMSIAAGVSVPDVFVMDGESGINAFAAGYGLDDAVVCVTKGSLSLLDRDELQGVVAHEFSHIFNGDMLMNIRLMGWLHGILLVGLAGQGLLRSLRLVRGRAGLAAGIVGILLYVFGSLGTFFGKLIKLALSRQREFLADASAVQYTRNPSGLAGALKKVGGLTFGSVLIHPRASEASHMFFCDGIGDSFMDMTATHPPLLERIRRLDSSFKGIFPKVKTIPVVGSHVASQTVPDLRSAIPLKILTGAAAAAILETIGTPMKEHEDIARNLLAGIPAPVRSAIAEPAGARAAIYVLLLDSVKEVRAGQIGILRQFESGEVLAEADTLAAYLFPLNFRLRLPLIDISVPALKRLSINEYQDFKQIIGKLVDLDKKLSLFECILGHVLIKRLDVFFSPKRLRPSAIYGIRGVARECSIVLTLLARTGQVEEKEAAEAFSRGKEMLMETKADFEFLDADECSSHALDGALAKLSTASPVIKRKLLAACLATLIFDNSIRVEEAELFRAVGETLECPMPPWVLFESSALSQAIPLSHKH
jgi:Zn-dependent protease with chaperone function